MVRNNGWLIVLGVTISLLAGCWTTKPNYEQRFQGIVTQDKKPVSSARVKLVNAENCNAKGGVETETDKRGRFQADRLTKYDADERPYQLCVFMDNNKWQSVWSQTKGPTPKSVEFQCDLADRTSDKCWVSWNKDGFKKGNWSR